MKTHSDTEKQLLYRSLHFLPNRFKFVRITLRMNVHLEFVTSLCIEERLRYCWQIWTEMTSKGYSRSSKVT